MKKILFMVALVAAVTFPALAQEEGDDQVVSRANKYLGLGLGFDYGGIGGKLEIMPTRHLGLFAGVGYNLLSVGWNAGASFNFSPKARVAPVARVFYGYNATLKVIDAGTDKYNKTSYGVTFGGGINIRMNAKGNVLSVNLFVPVRSKKFLDHYDEINDNPSFDMQNKLIPVALSVGYNFRK